MKHTPLEKLVTREDGLGKLDSKSKARSTAADRSVRPTREVELVQSWYPPLRTERARMENPSVG